VTVMLCSAVYELHVNVQTKGRPPTLTTICFYVVGGKARRFNDEVELAGIERLECVATIRVGCDFTLESGGRVL